MAEQLVLTTPVPATLSTWEVAIFHVDRRRQLILIEVVSNTGVSVQAHYTTPPPEGHESQPTGQFLISLINKRNFSTNSMQKQLLQQMLADGYFGPGTVTGTPE